MKKKIIIGILAVAIVSTLALLFTLSRDNNKQESVNNNNQSITSPLFDDSEINNLNIGLKKYSDNLFDKLINDSNCLDESSRVAVEVSLTKVTTDQKIASVNYICNKTKTTAVIIFDDNEYTQKINSNGNFACFELVEWQIPRSLIPNCQENFNSPVTENVITGDSIEINYTQKS